MKESEETAKSGEEIMKKERNVKNDEDARVIIAWQRQAARNSIIAHDIARIVISSGFGIKKKIAKTAQIAA